jgi:hypothetical protein
MGGPDPISRTEIEKSDGILKFVDHPNKPCGEKRSGDHYRVPKNFAERFKKLESVHFRRLPKCVQIADGATGLGDCKQWEVLSLKESLGK